MKYLIIDGSNFIIYRYFAIKRWWSFANKDIPFDDLSELFKNKFIKLMITKIEELKKKFKISSVNQIFFAKDCPRKQIWRNSIYDDYKKNRENLDQNKNIPFYINLTYSEILPSISLNNILYHPRLEGDDCIAITCKKLSNDENNEILIISGDTDLLQLSQKNINLFSPNLKNLKESKNYKKFGDLNLLMKIICGDKSDNIPPVFQKYSEKKIFEFLQDKNKINELLNESNMQEKYSLNEELIDFNKIPSPLIIEFYSLNSFFNYI